MQHYRASSTCADALMPLLQYEAPVEPPRRKFKAEHPQESAPCSPSDDRLQRKKSSFCRELHSLLDVGGADAELLGLLLGCCRLHAGVQCEAAAGNMPSAA